MTPNPEAVEAAAKAMWEHVGLSFDNPAWKWRCMCGEWTSPVGLDESALEWHSRHQAEVAITAYLSALTPEPMTDQPWTDEQVEAAVGSSLRVRGRPALSIKRREGS